MQFDLRFGAYVGLTNERECIAQVCFCERRHRIVGRITVSNASEHGPLGYKYAFVVYIYNFEINQNYRHFSHHFWLNI
jgi:hypothetical protein